MHAGRDWGAWGSPVAGTGLPFSSACTTCDGVRGGHRRRARLPRPGARGGRRPQGRARLDKSSLFRSPFLYWRGSDEFPPLSDAAIEGLRKYVHRGGFILIDDATAGEDGFDRAVRRELLRAFPAAPLRPISRDHTIYRSFYLLSRPVGRVEGPAFLEGMTYGDRIAIVYSRHDLGGAMQRDRLGAWSQAVVPGGEAQRERAIRLAVNLVLYALCTDYKDDQVHAPFIMRRRGTGP